MHLRGCAARYDGRPLEHVKFLNEIGKDVRPVAFFGRRPPTSRFPMSTSVSSISGPLRSLARSSHEGQWPGLFLVAPSSARSRSRRGMRVAVSLCLVSGWLVRPSLKTCGRRGVLLRRPPELLQKHGVGVESGGGGIIDAIISRKRKKKCNGFESAVVSPAAGSEREKEIEIDGSGDGGDERRSAAQALFCCCEGRRGRSSVNKRSVFVPHRMEEDAATGPSSDLMPCHHPNLQFSDSR